MTVHNKTSLMLCILGGILLIVSGTSGAIGVLSEIADGLRALFGLNLLITFETVMGALAILTVVAGVFAVIGGIILTTSHVRFGRIIIMLAITAGVAGLLMGLVQMVWVGDLVLDMMIQLQQSIGWIGAMLAVVARIIAEQKPMVDPD
jgi:hypothetical protein